MPFMNNLKRFRFWKLPALLTILLMMWSCYPYSTTNVDDYDVVVTTFDKDVNFSSFKTFSMPDSVVKLKGDIEVSDDYDALMLLLVRQNMENLDYTYIEYDTTAPKPDVIMAVGVVATKTTTISGGWGYPGWGWGGGWWGYPGYGWYYPPYYQVSSYSTGTVFVQMADPDEADPDEETIPVYWFARMNGLLRSSDSATESVIKKTINQAFEQSPYLGTD